jgi:tRNA A-37 threonylcarbamoyl transferase component Bud32
MMYSNGKAPITTGKIQDFGKIKGLDRLASVGRMSTDEIMQGTKPSLKVANGPSVDDGEKKSGIVADAGGGRSICSRAAVERVMSEQQPHLEASIELKEVADTVGLEKQSTVGEAREQSQADNFDCPRLDERFELLEPIGEGAMAYVWKVKDHSINQILALKLLRKELTQDPEAVSRFQQEARLAMELQHPHIAAVYEPGFDLDGRPYILMDFVPGQSLQQLLKQEGKLAEDRAMVIFKQICQALIYAHMHGVVHRDIKPSNIMISTTTSGAEFVKIVDFGIARSIHEEVHNTQALTRPLGDFATPRYMSPEQCLGQKVTAQSDIYSLGCVLHEMISGTPPFTETNQVRLIMQHLSEAPNLRNFSKSVGPILAMMLEKNLECRLESLDHIPEVTENTRDYYMVGLRASLRMCSAITLLGIGALIIQIAPFTSIPYLFLFASLAVGLLTFGCGAMSYEKNNTLQKTTATADTLHALLFYLAVDIGAISVFNILQRLEIISTSTEIIGWVVTAIALISAAIWLPDSKIHTCLIFVLSKMQKAAFKTSSNVNFKLLMAQFVVFIICATLFMHEISISISVEPFLLICLFFGILLLSPLVYFSTHNSYIKENFQLTARQLKCASLTLLASLLVPFGIMPTFYYFNPHLVRPDGLALNTASDLLKGHNNKSAIPGLIDRFLTKHEITTRKDFENAMRALEIRISLAAIQHDTAAIEQYTDRMISILQNQIKREIALNPAAYAQQPPEREIKRLLRLGRGKDDLTQQKISKMISRFVKTLPEAELNKWPGLKAQFRINNTQPGKRL